MKIVINKKNVLAAPHPEKGTDYYHDVQLKGFGLRVGKRTKTFFADRWVGTTRARVKLGEFPHLSVEEARKRAIKTLSDMASGINPNRQKEPSSPPTLQAVLEDFLKVRPLKARSIHEYRASFRRYFSDWDALPITEISKSMVMERHQKVTLRSGPVQANQCMRYLRSVLNFSKACFDDPNGDPYLTSNPVIQGLTETKSWNRTKRKQTVIPRPRLGVWFNAVLATREEKESLVSKTICDYLITCLFTGFRRQEGAQLKWEHVDLNAGIITLPDTKNHQPHSLPIPHYLRSLLESRYRSRSNDYVFPGQEGGPGFITSAVFINKIVTKKCGVPFSMHDLRRTFASIAEALGISGYTLKRLLNHQIQHDVTGGYIVSAYDTESLREPMNRIANFILSEAEADSTRV